MDNRGELQPGDAGQSRPYREDERRDPAGPDASVLERVLQETMASSTDRLRPQELAALTAVARRRRGDQLVLDPVVTELVAAILPFHFPAFDHSDPTWSDMSNRVASSLFEVPHVRDRLRDLWHQLCESTP
jgi:hypothetical protein